MSFLHKCISELALSYYYLSKGVQYFYQTIFRYRRGILSPPLLPSKCPTPQYQAGYLRTFKHLVAQAQSHLSHRMWGRSLVQKQERHFLVIIMCCNMERCETIL